MMIAIRVPDSLATNTTKKWATELSALDFHHRSSAYNAGTLLLPKSLEGFDDDLASSGN